MVITPLTITDAILTSSTVPEPDTGETAWNSGATYALGDRRYVASNHTMYESLIASNLGNDPTLEVQNDPDNPPTKWLEVGKTNRWQAIDLLRNTKSSGTSPMVIVLTPGKRIDAAGFFGLEADAITISMTVGATEVYSYTENLSRREVWGWYDYVFQAFSTKPSVALFDLPPSTGAVITITLTAASGTVKIGSIVIGSKTNIGNVEYGAESDVLNFSRIDRAFDGTVQLRPRRSIPKAIESVWAEKAMVNKIRDLRTNLNAVPAVWAGLDQTNDDYFEALLILGVYRKFTIDLSYPEHAKLSLEIEEI